MLGIKVAPKDSETKILITWIQDKFAENTLEQIKIAFELLIENKLDFDPQHFQNFSSLYFTNVMQAYKRFQMRTPPIEAAKEHISNPMKEGIIKTSCIDAYKEWERTGDVIDYRNIMYNYLKRLELMPFTEDERQEILGQAEEVYKAELEGKQTNNPEFKDTNYLLMKFTDKNDIGNIQAIAKDIALCKYFQQIKEFGFDLEDLINDKLK